MLKLLKGDIVNKRELFYFQAKEFLENFTLDFALLKEMLEKILQTNFVLHNCKRKVSISFDESKLFGKSGSVSQEIISFNKTRIEMLQELKIDDTDPEHLKKVLSFFNEYNENEKHTSFQENLYEFMKKYTQINAQWAFSQMGSYKTIKYEILATILHECEHIFQEEYSKYLYSENFPKDTHSKVLIFTILFNTIYKKLSQKGVELNYNRENHTFPIEFDARYESMKQLAQIKEKYFLDDVNFSKFLINSNIIPKNFNSQQSSNQIFDDYQRFYNLYTENFGFEYQNVHEYIMENRQIIVNNMTQRYDKMQKISWQERTFKM